MWEGIIKAFLCGLAVGLALSAIPAIIMLLHNYFNVWIALGVLVGGIYAATPIFYIALFRPTIKTVAHRVDRLGLEERLITMMEFEKTESYIAMAQREDARKKLAVTKSKSLKFSRFAMIPIIVALSITLALSTSTIVASAVSFVEDKLERDPICFLSLASGSNPGDTNNPGGPGYGDGQSGFFAVNFEVRLIVDVTEETVEVDGLQFRVPTPVFEHNEGGFIEGLSNQLVEYRQNADTITAIADPDFVFAGFAMWGYVAVDVEDHGRVMVPSIVMIDGDSRQTPNELTLTFIRSNMEVFVMFQEAGEGGGDDEGGEPGDEDGQGEPGEADVGDDGGDPGPGGPGDGGSGGQPEDRDRDDVNVIDDGQTLVSEMIQALYEQVRAALAAGEAVDPVLLALVEMFFGALNPN